MDVYTNFLPQYEPQKTCVSNQHKCPNPIFGKELNLCYSCYVVHLVRAKKHKNKLFRDSHRAFLKIADTYMKCPYFEENYDFLLDATGDQGYRFIPPPNSITMPDEDELRSLRKAAHVLVVQLLQREGEFSHVVHGDRAALEKGRENKLGPRMVYSEYGGNDSGRKNSSRITTAKSDWNFTNAEEQVMKYLEAQGALLSAPLATPHFFSLRHEPAPPPSPLLTVNPSPSLYRCLSVPGLTKRIENKTARRVNLGYLSENVGKKIKAAGHCKTSSRNANANTELEKETCTDGLRWPPGTGMLQIGHALGDEIPDGILTQTHVPTPRGFDHKDSGSRSTDAFVNVVAVLTKNGQHTEFVPLQSFVHCDGDDTHWENWEETVAARGRLSGGSFTNVLGATVFSSHRPHSQAAAPYGVPVVKVFATYGLNKTPFNPLNDEPRFCGLPQSMWNHPCPKPGDYASAMANPVKRKKVVTKLAKDAPKVPQDAEKPPPMCTAVSAVTKAVLSRKKNPLASQAYDDRRLISGLSTSSIPVPAPESSTPARKVLAKKGKKEKDAAELDTNFKT